MRLPPGIRGALNEIARTERRSVGNLITKVMEDYIEANGHMLCPECHGAGTVGMTEEAEPEMCDTCDGLGHVKRRK
jgi:DnaJ-class molecular chaperone